MNEQVLAQIEVAAAMLDTAAQHLHGAASDLDADEPDAEVIHAGMVQTAADLALVAARMRMKVRRERVGRTMGEGTGSDGEEVSWP